MQLQTKSKHDQNYSLCFALSYKNHQMDHFCTRKACPLWFVYLLTQIKLNGPPKENDYTILMVYSKRQRLSVKTSLILKQKTSCSRLNFYHQNIQAHNQRMLHFQSFSGNGRRFGNCTASSMESGMSSVGSRTWKDLWCSKTATVRWETIYELNNRCQSHEKFLTAPIQGLGGGCSCTHLVAN